jgi:hypothetical protein
VISAGTKAKKIKTTPLPFSFFSKGKRFIDNNNKKSKHARTRHEQRVGDGPIDEVQEVCA